jgi:hypothetical protein
MIIQVGAAANHLTDTYTQPIRAQADDAEPRYRIQGAQRRQGEVIEDVLLPQQEGYSFVFMRLPLHTNAAAQVASIWDDTRHQRGADLLNALCQVCQSAYRGNAPESDIHCRDYRRFFESALTS